jgi:hypothetical protein
VRGLPPEVQKKLLLSVGSHRAARPLSPVEVGEAIQASLDAGSSLQEIAGTLLLEDTSVLTKFIRLLRLAPEVQHLVDWGRSDSTVGFTVASEIARLPDPLEQIQLCEVGLRHQLGSAEMKQVMQLRRRSKKPIEACVKEILRLRPRIQRIHVFLGAITSPEICAGLAKLSQMQRNDMLRSLVKVKFPPLANFGCRLGPNGFTVTGGEDVATVLSQGGKDFEATINEALAETVAS